MCRGVTRLDGARDKKQVSGLAPSSNLRSFRSKCTVLKQVLKTLWLFGRPEWFGTLGIIPPCPPRYVCGVLQQISENFPKINKFSSQNVMNSSSMNICNFRTQYGSDHAQTADKGYWRHFRFIRVVFVSRICLPHAFFRRGPVFVLLIIKFSGIQQVTFWTLDKFENNFWIVLKAASAPKMSHKARVMWECDLAKMSMVLNSVC